MLTISVLTSLRLYFIGSTDLASAWKEQPERAAGSTAIKMVKVRFQESPPELAWKARSRIFAAATLPHSDEECLQPRDRSVYTA